ncbi:MAG: hypothetical protein AAF990_02560 [Bacteroidota bacterium]
MNRSILLNAIFALSVLVSMIGCRKEKAEPIIDINIAEEFYVDLWEELDPELKTFKLRLPTIQKQACPQTTLDYDFQANGQQFVISLQELVSPDNCVTDSSFINTDVLLGDLANGTYSLRINLKEEVVNKGELSVNEEKYTINMESLHGLSLVRSELLRVPDQTIWGTFGFNKLQLSDAKDEFLQELQNMSGLKIYPTGYYGYFSIQDDGSVDVPVESNFAFNSPFILQLNSTKQALIDLLNRYRNDYGSDIEIKLFTYEGKEL